MKKLRTILLAISNCSVAMLHIYAAPVNLQNATATFSQNYVGVYSVDKAINATTADNLGWAILDQNSGRTDPETAVFETGRDVGFPTGTVFTFQLMQFHSNPGHTLGRFRLSLTTDDRSFYADGLSSAGDVTANWTVLDIDSAVSANGVTLTELGDHSILASGFAPDTDLYTITATTSMTAITGVRIEVLADPSLPTNGPGRRSDNGNFVLSEFTVDASVIPEPSVTILFISSAALCFRRRKLTHLNEVPPLIEQL